MEPRGIEGDGSCGPSNRALASSLAASGDKDAQVRGGAAQRRGDRRRAHMASRRRLIAASPPPSTCGQSRGGWLTRTRARVKPHGMVPGTRGGREPPASLTCSDGELERQEIYIGYWLKRRKREIQNSKVRRHIDWKPGEMKKVSDRQPYDLESERLPLRHGSGCSAIDIMLLPLKGHVNVCPQTRNCHQHNSVW